jgi:transmembrane sensor
MIGSETIPMTIAKGPNAAEEAAEWLARMTSGSLSDTQLEAFGRWVEVPANAEAYNEAEALWLDLERAMAHGDNVVELRPRKRRLHFGRQHAAMAASLALAFLGAHQYLSVWQYDHATQGSQIASVALSDGSHVELNTHSAIDYEFRDGVRHVVLAKGEAFFDVKHDAAQPFVIDAGGASVRVLGTAFSVRRDRQGGEVIVQRGKVRVTTSSGEVDLPPNQMVSYQDRGVLRPAKADAAKALSWSRGVLVMEDKPLGDVLAELDRYYPGMIILSDKKAANSRIDAVIKLNEIDGWLAALRQSHGLKVRFLPGLTLVG